MRGKKRGWQEGVWYILEERFPPGFLGRRKWRGPRDATFTPRVCNRYPSSAPTTKPRVGFIKMLNPPFIPPRGRGNQFDDITDPFSPPFSFPRHSCPNFDFVWITRAWYRLTCRMRKRKSGGRGEGGRDGKIYEGRGDVLKGLEMRKRRVPWATRLDRCASRISAPVIRRDPYNRDGR